MKTFNIEIPEGYEIDKERSSLEKGNIVFKKLPKNKILRWKDIKYISGVYIDSGSTLHEYACRIISSNDINIFVNEKYAKSALAYAQLSQVYQHYNKNEDWGNHLIDKYCVIRLDNELKIVPLRTYFSHWSFATKEEAELFLENNIQQLKDFYMM